MHGSLLPKYRGRAPVHWAIIHGETMTGASLHYMVEKPDAGALVDQEAVPILENDTALEVSLKVADAAANGPAPQPAAFDRGHGGVPALGLEEGLLFWPPHAGGRTHRLAPWRTRHTRSGACRRAAFSGRLYRGQRVYGLRCWRRAWIRSL